MTLRNQETIFEIVVICAMLLMYCANRFYSLFDGVVPVEFANNHLNDICAGLFIASYINLLFLIGRQNWRISSPLQAFVLGTTCGIIWEGIAPYIVSYSVPDILDVFSYLIGCFVYIAVRKILIRQER